MRLIVWLLLLSLLLPRFALAQDTAPIIAVQPYLRQQDIYALREGTAPARLMDADSPQLTLSPDGGKIAVLDFPAFVQAESELEPGDYPDDLFVISLASGGFKPLVTHDERMTLGSTSGSQFYNGDFRFRGGLSNYLAWSPDSSHIAQVQTVVKDGLYPGRVRLVVYDVAAGSMSEIAELGAQGTRYGVFWMEAGIVLYGDPEAGDASVTVFAPDGTVLYEWDFPPSRTIASENPVRYEGTDYLAFEGANAFDVTTGEFTVVNGAIARVSAAAPEESLLIEACMGVGNQYTWDVYNAQGEKLTKLSRTSTPALSPDGSQVVYVAFDNNRAVTIFDGSDSYPLDTDGEGTPFAGDSVLWGATMYVFTPIGVDECGRGPARG